LLQHSGNIVKDFTNIILGKRSTEMHTETPDKTQGALRVTGGVTCHSS